MILYKYFPVPITAFVIEMGYITFEGLYHSLYILTLCLIMCINMRYGTTLTSLVLKNYPKRLLTFSIVI